MPFYTPPADDALKIENDPNYIVPVIASFSTNGDVQPLYFQFDDKTIKIFSVHWCKKQFNTYYFECTAMFDNFLREINLTYYPDKNCWTMNSR